MIKSFAINTSRPYELKWKSTPRAGTRELGWSQAEIEQKHKKKKNWKGASLCPAEWYMLYIGASFPSGIPISVSIGRVLPDRYSEGWEHWMGRTVLGNIWRRIRTVTKKVTWNIVWMQTWRSKSRRIIGNGAYSFVACSNNSWPFWVFSVFPPSSPLLPSLRKFTCFHACALGPKSNERHKKHRNSEQRSKGHMELRPGHGVTSNNRACGK